MHDAVSGIYLDMQVFFIGKKHILYAFKGLIWKQNYVFITNTVILSRYMTTDGWMLHTHVIIVTIWKHVLQSENLLSQIAP